MGHVKNHSISSKTNHIIFIIMDFIPIEPEGDLGSLIESFTKFSFSFIRVDNPGDYENESMISLSAAIPTASA